VAAPWLAGRGPGGAADSRHGARRRPLLHGSWSRPDLGLECWVTNVILANRWRTDRGRKRPRGALIAACLAFMLSCPGWLAPLTVAGASAMPSPPAHTVHGGEFLSPSGNISCEIDNGYIGLHQVYCQTISPPESVVLSLTGTIKVCKGQQCLGNPGVNTPVLAYGRSTGSGPFRCLSTTAGVTCTAGAKGFQISRSGIKAVRSGSSK
jgi:hypothetical protein